MALKMSLFFLVILGIESVIAQNTTVRLIPGPDKGRLEIFHDGTWGTICEYDTKNAAASVACGSINQPSNNSYWVTGSQFGRGSFGTHLSQVTCSGSETSLFDCSVTYSNKSCTSSYVKGLVCTNDKLPASIGYSGLAKKKYPRIDIMESNYVYCYAGTSSYTRDFQCVLRGVGLYDSGTCPEGFLVKKENQGPLTCTISNWQMPDQDTVTVELNVMYPPNDFVKSQVTFIEHSEANVSLSNLPNPLPNSTTWQRTGTNRIWNQTEVFRFYKSISREDAGVFLVNISNIMNSTDGRVRMGSGLELVIVDVLYAPSMRCKQNYAVTEGSEVNITCEVHANPSPDQYIWSDSSGDVVSKGSKPSLVIASVGPEHIGRYKCIVVNKMQDSTGKTESGIGIAEMEIMFGHPTDHTSQQDNGQTPAPSTQNPPMSAVTYAMIGIAVVLLVVVLIMAVIIFKMRNTEGVRGTSHESNTDNRIGDRVHYVNESAYTTLDYSEQRSMDVLPQE